MRRPRAGAPSVAALLMLALALAGCLAGGGSPARALPDASPGPLPSAAAPPAAPGRTAPTPVPADHTTLAAERAGCDALARPGRPLTLSADPAAPTPLTPREPYLLTLGPTGGFATLTLPLAGEWSLFLGQDAFFVVRGTDGAVIFDQEETAPALPCPAIARHRVFDLVPGAPYLLDFGPDLRAIPFVATPTHP